MGGPCPQTSYQVSIFCKIAIFSISIIENMDFTSMWARACSWTKFFYLRRLLQIYAPKIFESWLISQKKLQLQRLGTASQRPLPNFILPSYPIITVDLSKMWTIEHISRTQSWQWVTFCDPWPIWPIGLVTHDPLTHDPLTHLSSTKNYKISVQVFWSLVKWKSWTNCTKVLNNYLSWTWSV